MIQSAFIRLNNRVTRWRRVQTAPGRLLLLAAHCLQGSACGQNLNRGVDQCKGCGLCPVKELLALRNRYGVRCVIASGGRQAVAAVKDPGVSAVVAVACEKELVEGILASFPKPVLAVCNTRPNGPCHDTQVQVVAIESALREMLHVTPLPIPNISQEKSPS
jgi:hypothetical protein